MTGNDAHPRPADREIEVYAAFTERAKTRFGALVSPDLIEEHRQDPLGEKSPALLHLLDLMRQAPLDGKLAVYAIEPGSSYQIIRLSGRSDVGHDTTDPQRFATEAQALHEVFLRRLGELGLIEHPTPAAGQPSWPQLGDPHIIGYTDRLDARPGEDLTVHLSADHPVTANATLVRLGYGEPTGEVREEPVAELGQLAISPQHTTLGSSASTGALSERLAAECDTFAVTFMPTLPDARGLIAGQHDRDGNGWALLIDSSHLRVEHVRDGVWTPVCTLPHPLTRGAWYSTAVRFGPQSTTLAVAPVRSRAAQGRHAASDQPSMVTGDAIGGLLPHAVSIAGWPQPHDRWCFNGKVETPFLASDPDPQHLVAMRSTLVAVRDIASARLLWDPAAALTGPPPTSIPAFTRGQEQWQPHAALDAACINTPAWAVTGSHWDGGETDFRRSPEQWAALHFHSDDLDDARWDIALTLTIPEHLRSGAYAVKVDDGGHPPERLPLFVEPVSPRAKVAVIIPTASYAAYANDHPGTQAQMAQATASRTPVLLAGDLFMHDHPELGRSCYDCHSDGSGVGYTSLRRPLLNMRPTHRYHVGAWQLPADLHLISWLNDEGIDYEVITDHSLHRRGGAALEPYTAVMTTTHSEYYSTDMLDAVQRYIDGGGRFMYLGANGFYWRVAFDPDRPWIMELRRGENGSRAWQSRPGEHHHAFTGERGGLWTNLGRASNQVFGVGFAAQGFDSAGWYRRTADSRDPRAAFIFQGVAGETFGHQGTEGGAVGQEVDRYDLALGTPPDTLLLATSEGLSEGYLRAVEEIYFLVSGTSASVDHKVRADMTYLVNAAGGAVFSTGSIAWCGSLGLDPGTSRITRNVLARFCRAEPLDW
ncbi:MAG: N,N-dimethylformamidase beta subunit family domain-containing protein [Beutenbergiaceae bacterium]